MTTKYIILTKDERDATDDNRNNQIFFVNKPLTYLMPSVNHTYYAERGLFENNLIEWCKQFCKKDATFLDIGAHTGSYAITLAPYSGKVVAFEPQKMTYYALCGGVALSGATNIDCLKLGLGNESQNGAKTLHIVSNDGVIAHHHGIFILKHRITNKNANLVFAHQMRDTTTELSSHIA